MTVGVVGGGGGRAVQSADVCEEAGLPNFVKTTGKTGLHILIPLGHLRIQRERQQRLKPTLLTQY